MFVFSNDHECVFLNKAKIWETFKYSILLGGILFPKFLNLENSFTQCQYPKSFTRPADIKTLKLHKRKCSSTFKKK